MTKNRIPTEIKVISGVLGLFIVLALTFFLSPFVIVDTTERAVIINLGTLDRVLDEGVHWKTPFVESVVVYDVSTQKYQSEATAASQDLQDVTTTVAVQYNIDPMQVEPLYREYRTNVSQSVLEPAIEDAIKAGTAAFNAEALITRRPEVKELIEQTLRERLSEAYINVTNVDIIDFKFSESFSNAIEAKVTAEQEAQKAENDLARVEFEAQQRIEQAKAEAEAIKIQAEAITQQGGRDYVNLKSVEKWDGKLPQQFVPGSAVPFINL